MKSNINGVPATEKLFSLIEALVAAARRRRKLAGNPASMQYHCSLPALFGNLGIMHPVAAAVSMSAWPSLTRVPAYP